MNYDEALRLFNDIKTTEKEILLRDLMSAAINYSNYRYKWHMTDSNSRRELDSRRTIAHNAFIDACNILSRNMNNDGEDISWRYKLGDDRGEIGDFACYLCCIIGLAAR